MSHYYHLLIHIFTKKKKHLRKRNVFSVTSDLLKTKSNSSLLSAERMTQKRNHERPLYLLCPTLSLLPCLLDGTNLDRSGVAPSLDVTDTLIRSREQKIGRRLLPGISPAVPAGIDRALAQKAGGSPAFEVLQRRPMSGGEGMPATQHRGESHLPHLSALKSTPR